MLLAFIDSGSAPCRKCIRELHSLLDLDQISFSGMCLLMSTLNGSLKITNCGVKLYLDIDIYVGKK